MEYLELFVPMVIVVFIIVAAYFATKVIAKKQGSITSGRLIKIIEQVPVGKDSSLAIIDVGGKVFLISVSSGKTEIMQELPNSILDNVPVKGQTDFLSLLKSFTGKKQPSDNHITGEADEKDF